MQVICPGLFHPNLGLGLTFDLSCKVSHFELLHNNLINNSHFEVLFFCLTSQSTTFRIDVTKFHCLAK